MHAVVLPPVVSQQAFASALLDPARDLPTGLRVGAGIDPARRFAVHRNNVVVALVDALAAAFPVTQALVGEDFFRAMARARVQADPPRSPIVADYGDGFAKYIAGFIAGSITAAGVPYLADMARLERLRARAYHAADAEPIAADAYRALVATPMRLAATRLKLHPACDWLHSRYAVHSLWQAHQDLDDPRDARLGTIAIDRSEAVLVTRPHWQVQVVALPNGAVARLDALRAGQTLGVALAPADGADGNSLESLLTLIVQNGLAVALDSPLE